MVDAKESKVFPESCGDDGKVEDVEGSRSQDGDGGSSSNNSSSSSSSSLILKLFMTLHLGIAYFLVVGTATEINTISMGTAWRKAAATNTHLSHLHQNKSQKRL